MARLLHPYLSSNPKSGADFQFSMVLKRHSFLSVHKPFSWNQRHHSLVPFMCGAGLEPPCLKSPLNRSLIAPIQPENLLILNGYGSLCFVLVKAPVAAFPPCAAIRFGRAASRGRYMHWLFGNQQICFYDNILNKCF